MNDDLLNLSDVHKEAISRIEEALRIAGNLLTEDDGQPIPWPEMEIAAARLEAARLLLTKALEPVAEAIAEEQKRWDEGSDKAEAQRG